MLVLVRCMWVKFQNVETLLYDYEQIGPYRGHITASEESRGPAKQARSAAIRGTRTKWRLISGIDVAKETSQDEGIDDKVFARTPFPAGPSTSNSCPAGISTYPEACSWNDQYMRSADSAPSLQHLSTMTKNLVRHARSATVAVPMTGMVMYASIRWRMGNSQRPVSRKCLSLGQS